MSTPKISGTFVSEPPLPEGVEDAGVVHVGFVRIGSTDVELTDRRSVRFLPSALGLVGGLIACPIPLLLTWALDGVGFDLMAMRRGTTLVAVFTMVFFGLGFTSVSTASAWLFSKESRRTVSRNDCTVIQEGAFVTFVWSEGGRRVGGMLAIPEDQRERVLQEL